MADWHLYCEESCKTERKFVLGGILIESEKVNGLTDGIGRWRQRRGLVGEINWKKTTQNRLERYSEFVTGSLMRAERGDLLYRCAVFDRHEDAHFPGEPEAVRLGRRLYHFLLHCFVLSLRGDDRLFLFLDKGLLPGHPSDLRKMLNCGIAGHRHQQPHGLVHWVQELDSKMCDFIQMADVLTGAIGSALNCNRIDGSSRGAAKARLIEHMSSRLKIAGFHETIECRGGFGLWHVPARQKKHPGPYPALQEVLAEPRLSVTASALPSIG
ncbi:hypothetical protein Pla175_01420 [Pirellulimonas nuda]|uniref:DUF3800 domain-containing protein n=2 Tax=Pirellulimonas nuda TaxID=2528009 RepID=A0A518D5Q0_9BACT|nr:hypothetical protein Pla175_01420 [Pirellulimonas nuda]